VFTPIRSDWDDKTVVGTPEPRWPEESATS
jgi:hypothetical protein